MPGPARGVTRFTEKDPGRYGDYFLTGRVDRIDELADGSLEVIDYKSGAHLPSPAEVADDLAIAIYQLLCVRLLARVAVKGSILHLLSGQKVSVTRSPAALEPVAAAVDDLHARIRSEQEFARVADERCEGCDFFHRCFGRRPRGSRPRTSPHDETDREVAAVAGARDRHPAGTLLALAQLLLVYLVLRFLLNNIVGRIVVPLASRETSGARKERAARLHTLAGVVRSTGNYVLTFIIVLVALKKFGVDTTPVLASASVVGLAVGFGSQKLVRDVTTGFFLLAESQFDVGDYVTISGITGTVEEVGMRTTRLRDDAGKLYILSNGDISTVCNHSAGLVNLFLDFAVPATEIWIGCAPW